MATTFYLPFIGRCVMTDNHQPIPQYETEVIKAKGGDTEKVATTSVRLVTVNGVNISSRYEKADEYELMRLMVCALPRELVKLVRSIDCDSNNSFDYTVIIN